jgi:hypothetical protein
MNRACAVSDLVALETAGIRDILANGFRAFAAHRLLIHRNSTAQAALAKMCSPKQFPPLGSFFGN